VDALDRSRLWLGISDNVADAYQFLMKTFETGDRVMSSGSVGALTRREPSVGCSMPSDFSRKATTASFPICHPYA